MSLRESALNDLRTTYDKHLDKESEAAIEQVARAVADVKNAGAPDREAMDALRSRDWRRYKRYKDYAREKGWING